jgi:hypothetical protein
MKKAAALLYKHPFGLYTLFLVIAFLPVLLPFSHLKNDLITQNLPTRFVISESLYSGYFPWWNPYINFGIPQYGDMNTGFWNPMIFIISKTVGYNIYTITIEELVYILLGGWGIYKLSVEFFSKEAALVSGIAYMACGYTVGHLQHFCWITGIAFFPYVLLFYVRALKNHSAKNFIGGAFAFFFFVAASHPGLIIGAIYFVLFAILFIFTNRNGVCQIIYIKKFWLITATFFVIGILMSAVVIISDLDVLRYVSRGMEISEHEMLMNPTTFQSYLSLIVPLSVNKSSFFMTDISMRNVYFGLAGIFGTIVFFKNANAKILQVVLPALLFFALLSAGGAFKLFFSQLFPLIRYVRMNGEFNYFVILIFIFSSTAGLHTYINKKNDHQIKSFLYILTWIFIGLIISSLLIMWIENDTLFPLVNKNQTSIKHNIKYIIDSLTFWQLMIIGSLLQLITILVIRKIKTSNWLVMSALCANLILNTWLILPFTGLGERSKKEFDDLINRSEKGIHIPELVPLNETIYLDSALSGDLWLIASYSKKIGFKEELYPIQLKTNKSFFTDAGLVNFIASQPYIFLSKDTVIGKQTSTITADTAINILSFEPGYIKALVSNKDFSYITLLQNNYPYWRVKINAVEARHFTGFKTFITAPLTKGNSIVEFYFDPKPIRIACWVSIFFASLGIAILFNRKWRDKSFFS